jgi:hypothetical protein
MLWRKNQRKPEQEKNRNFRRVKFCDVGAAEERMDICALLEFAEFVFAN